MTTSSARYSAAQALRSGGVEAVGAALQSARARTLALFDALSPGLGPGLRVPREPGLNPPLWEFGHLAWFQEYWIARNPRRFLGASCPSETPRTHSLLPGADDWYDSSRVAHESRWTLPLPPEGPTLRYLADTLGRTLELLEALPSHAGPDDLYFFRLAALHEHMHSEAGAYMSRALGLGDPNGSAAGAPRPIRALQVAAQRFRLGTGEPGFAFDNELDAHEVDIAAFEIDDRPVSAASFAGFAEAGGYSQRRWWTDEGWAWLERQPAARWRIDALGPADRARPAVHLSAHEAEAWCRWAGRRLPTEAEWECAALAVPGFHWGEVWEWTASPFLPYPGFVAHPYRDYSMPWFGSRRVLRGASTATSEWLAHPRYRNFFEPERVDIFAGFRSCA